MATLVFALSVLAALHPAAYASRFEAGAIVGVPAKQCQSDGGSWSGIDRIKGRPEVPFTGTEDAHNQNNSALWQGGSGSVSCKGFELPDHRRSGLALSLSLAVLKSSNTAETGQTLDLDLASAAAFPVKQRPPMQEPNITGDGNLSLDGLLRVLVSGDAGKTWRPLHVFDESALSNAGNGGYFSIALPADIAASADSLAVRIEGLREGENSYRTYLDSAFFTYEVAPKRILSLAPRHQADKATKPVFNRHRPAAFRLELDTEGVGYGEGIGVNVGEAAGRSYEPDADIGVTVTGPDGKEIGNVAPEVVWAGKSVNGDDEWDVTIDQPSTVTPGEYTAVVTVSDSDGNTQSAEQDFLWGVLALNTHKSTYRAGETVDFDMAVLNEKGEMTCDAEVELLIDGPSRATLSTDDGSITVNDECRVRGKTERPDYEAHWEIPGLVMNRHNGQYKTTLTAKTANGSYSITDNFTVGNPKRMLVERNGNTRIMPVHDYRMEFKVTPEKDFKGTITETVPKGFKIVKTEAVGVGNPKVQDSGSDKKLVWDVNLQAGRTYEFGYVYDAPNVSPEFWLLGPLTFTANGETIFSEQRQWQIAGDDVENLWASSHITGDAASPGNALGATDGTWTSNTSNDSWSSRWAMEDPARALTGTQTINIIARKDASGGNGDPTFTADLYENGSLVSTVVSSTTVTDGGVTGSGTFDASAVTNANNVEILVSVSGQGGQPAGRRTVQIDSIEWEANLEPIPITFDQSAYRWFENADAPDQAISFMKATGGTGSDIFRSVIQTSDDGYLVAGNTSSYGAGAADGYLAKYDSAGTLEWSRTAGGTGGDYLTSVIQTSDGGFLAAGNTSSYGAGDADGYLVKYDSTGTLEWSRTAGGTGFEIFNSVLQTNDNGFVVAGRTDSYGAGAADGYLVKYDSAGTLEWSRTAGGTENDFFKSVIQTSDGGYLAAGNIEPVVAGDATSYLVKYDSAGTIEWSRIVNGNNYEFFSSVIQASDGGYLAVGHTNSFGAGSYDGLISKYDSSGNISGCSTPTCQSLTPSTSSPTSSTSSPTSSTSSPTSSTSSPTSSVSSPDSTQTIIAEPPVPVGSPLNGVSQDTATTAPDQGTPFRLRMNLHVDTAELAQSGQDFKLQYAERGTDDVCDTGFTGETYADVDTASGAIRYYDNTNADDGMSIATNADDPVHSGHTNIHQTYNEANNFTNSAAIPAGQDGIWDFALVNNSAPGNTSYCFRVIKNTGSLVDAYSVIPEITTPEPTFDQSAYRWFEDGNELQSDDTWTEATSAAGWTGRSSHATAVFNDKLWVIGGLDGVVKNDVWSSTDGSTWTQETSAAAWSGRYDLTAAVFNDKLWVIGGFDVTNKNDVWSSTDGSTWTQETSAAAWTGREGHTTTVFNNKLWVVGGYDGSYKNDVWSSTDGSTWTQETSAAAWSGRTNHTMVVFNNKLWVVGGYDGSYKNDVWSSTDGSTWTQETAAPWGARRWHTTTVFNNKLWVVGGYDGSYKNDVWSSTDGSTWTQETAAPWSTRGRHATDVFNNKLWVTGGYDGSYKNDVWYLSSGVDVGSPLAAQDTAATAPVQGSPFRLRMNLHVDTAELAKSGQDFKLQYAQRGTDDVCDTGFTDETYADVGTASGTIRYYDNTNAADGDSLASNANDPVHSGHTTVTQTYEEANDFTNSQGAIPAGQDGMWDFALVDNSALADTPYCFRALESGGNNLDTYTVVAEITTAPDPVLNQSAYRWFENEDSSSQAVTFMDAVGGTGTDVFNSVIQTSDGGYLAASYTNSYGAGGTDGYLVKYDSAGTVEWSRTAGGTADDYFYSVIQTSDDGYLAAGESSSYGAGGWDSYLVKYDSTGTLEWSRTAGGSSNDYFNSVIQTSDGGYLAAGRTDSYGAGGTDGYLVKYDSAGTVEWSRTAGGTSVDILHSLIQTSDGGYLAAGRTGSYGAGLSDGYMVKYDSAGTVEWSRTAGGTGNDYFRSVIQTSDGGFLAAGYTDSYGAGGTDGYMVKYDSAGTIEWSRTAGGTGTDIFHSVIQTSDGGYLAASYTTSYGAGGNDGYMVKYDSAGTIEWSRTAGDTGTDIFSAVIQTSDDGYLAAGYTFSYGSGNADGLVAKYDSSGNISGCSSPLCQSPSTTSSSPSSSTSSPSSSTSSPSSSTSSPSSSVSSPDSTQTIIVVASELGVPVGNPLNGVSQDTATTAPVQGSPFRLRMNLHVSDAELAESGQDFKLQYAARGTDDVCDTGFSGETYADVNNSGDITVTTSAGAAVDNGGSNETWTNPGRVTASDDSRADATFVGMMNSNYLKTSAHGFSIPSGSTVNGITVEVEKSASHASAIRDSGVHIVKNDIAGTTDKSKLTYWGTSDTYATYGGATDLWGETWTPADINSSNFGMAIAAKNEVDFETRDAYIDHIRITVHYTYVNNEAIQFYDNTNATDGMSIATNADDPVHSGHTNVNQTYEESNNFTNSVAAIPAGQDGMWDFALVDNSAPADTPYCFRTVKSDGSVIDTYSTVPEITTAGSGSNTAPDSPTSPAQLKTDDTVMSTGDWTNETSVKFSATASDPDSSDTLQLCVEAVELGTAFTNTETACGSGVAYSGSPVTVTVTLSGLVDTGEYHWQARIKDSGGLYSDWVSYGGNPESERDYGIDTTAPTGGDVYDGSVTGTDASFNDGSLSELSANWANFNFDVSGIDKYEYSIGTTQGGTDTKAWTGNATATSASVTGLTLRTTQIYYFNVRAVDNAGNTSVVSSDGIFILPTLSFGVSPTSVTFNDLNAGNSHTDTDVTALTTSTNAYAGYVVRARAVDTLNNPGGANIPWFDGGSYALPDSWQAGDTGYGYTSDDTSIQGVNKFQDDPCLGGSTLAAPGCYAPFTTTGPGDIVADHLSNVISTPITNETFNITHRVTAGPGQPAGDYSSTIIYMVTAEY